MEAFPNQLVVTDNHTSGTFATQWTQSRTSYYGITGIPTVVFDGIDQAIGAGSCDSAYNTYRTKINNRLNSSPNAPVRIEGCYSDDGLSLTMSATFTKDLAQTIANARAYLELTENGCVYGGTTYNHINRAVYEQAVTLTNVGDEVTVEHTFTLNPLWNVDNFQCVAFIQNTASREVYQAAYLPMVLDFAAAFDPEIASVPEGNGTAELAGVCENVGDVPDNLTFELRNTTGWAAEFMVEGDAGFHTTPVTYPMAVGQTRQLWLRVHTNADIRVGTLYIDVTSAVSERTAGTPARVFNGSPAVLFVDDDGNRADEPRMLAGLDAANILYDNWDTYYDHNGVAPAVDEMGGYDVVIWHGGWQTMQLMTEEDQAAMMTLMDGGMGFIMSSQSFLEAAPGPNATFLSDYLGVASFTSSVGADLGVGIASDPISDGMNLPLNEYPQAWWDRADDLAPSATGVVAMHNELGNRIAMRTESRAGKAVFFAFALNAIEDPALPDPNNIKTLLARAVDYVKPGDSQGVDDMPLAQNASSIQVLANPLNAGRSAAVLQLSISPAAANQAGRVDVVDATGRLVRNLHNGALPVGTSALSWDGRDGRGHLVSAGVYYVNMNTVDGRDGAKLVVVR